MSTQKKPATIYRITNLQNGYVYIGSTVKPIDERLKQHFLAARCGRTSNPMYEDMRKHSKELFKIEKIVTVQWYERWETEKHFTRLAKKYGDCYNIAEGTSITPPAETCKKVVCVDTGETYKSISSLARHLNLHQPNVSTYIKNRKKIHGKLYVIMK